MLEKDKHLFEYSYQTEIFLACKYYGDDRFSYWWLYIHKSDNNRTTLCNYKL